MNTNQWTKQDTKQVSWLLVGGGVLGSLYLLIKENRNIFSWIIPVGMMAAGIDLLMGEHREHIKQSGDQIIAQLDELDPITRAEVVKYLADQEVERISG